jgi:GntR family transcriptional regulator/MocR family aminotransferase
MSKTTATLPLVLSAPAPGVPRYRWLYEELRAAILDGRLKPHARLPATRDLARQYGLSRGTLLLAFDWLRSEGFVAGKVGAGTYVLPLEERVPPPSPPAAQAPPRLSEHARRVTAFPDTGSRPLRAFRANLPALDAFPSVLWGRVASRRLRRGTGDLLAGGDTLGDRALREAIAEYLTTMRGVRCTAAQIAVLSGAQEALDLVARLLLDPGDPVWMEDPGYPGATLVFRALGARLLAAPVDGRGLDVERARRELGPARLAYVTPAHQFPLGVVMDAERRLALLRWAEESGAFILEDDYDGEYRYAGRPVAALQGLDRSGRVIYMGTFSKVLFPGLRLGYLVLPDALVDTFAAALSITSRSPPAVSQALVCDFITAGHFGRHIRRMRQLYAERLAVLVEASERKLGGLLELSRPTLPEAGLQTVGWLAPGIDEEAATAAAEARGVEVFPVGRFALEHRPSPSLLLGFAAVGTDEIRRGVDELARALEGLARAPAR